MRDTKDIVGKNVLLPLVNKEIPVVADYYVDKRVLEPVQ